MTLTVDIPTYLICSGCLVKYFIAVEKSKLSIQFSYYFRVKLLYYNMLQYLCFYENMLFTISGPAPLEDIAKQIISCSGPSGTNKDYVYKLAETMRNLMPGIKDDHLFALEEALRKLEKSAQPQTTG